MQYAIIRNKNDILQAYFTTDKDAQIVMQINIPHYININRGSNGIKGAYSHVGNSILIN